MRCSQAWKKTMMISTLHAPWKSHPQLFHHDHRERKFKCDALSKAGLRFFTSVATKTGAGDTNATNHLIKKFVAASPKSVALDALSHLLNSDSSHQHLYSIAYPLYLKITEAPWFVWNTKLAARVVAFLDRQCNDNESAMLLSDCVSKLQSRERELALFYCELVETQSRHGPSRGFDDCYARLKEITRDSSSVYVKRQGYKAMISGLCEVGRPREAEELIGEMGGERIKPSVFEFRCVLYGYGRLGLFEDMQRSVDKMSSEGFEIDTVCSNMILSSYGAHDKLPEMVMWLRKMKSLGIPFSIRSYNSVLNSCPSILSLLQENSIDDYPVSLEELVKFVNEDEAMLVEELVGSSVLNEVMEWNALEGKLDLHGMHLGSAYLIMLQWMDELRRIFSKGTDVVPVEITVVCGSGNHSSVRGESPVKLMVKEIMVRTESPMRIGRKNLGCFVAKGKVVKAWLV